MLNVITSIFCANFKAVAYEVMNKIDIIKLMAVTVCIFVIILRNFRFQHYSESFLNKFKIQRQKFVYIGLPPFHWVRKRIRKYRLRIIFYDGRTHNDLKALIEISTPGKNPSWIWNFKRHCHKKRELLLSV